MLTKKQKITDLIIENNRLTDELKEISEDNWELRSQIKILEKLLLQALTQNKE